MIKGERTHQEQPLRELLSTVAADNRRLAVMEHRGPSARADGAKDDIRVGDGRSISHSTHRNEDEERPRLAASQARGIRRSSSVVGAREREEEAAAAGTGEGGEEEEYDEEDEYEGDDSVNGISSSKTTTEQISTTNGSARGHLDSGPRSHKDDKGAKSNTVGSGDGEGGQKKRRAFKACTLPTVPARAAPSLPLSLSVCPSLLFRLTILD